MNIPSRCFTTINDGISRVLRNDVMIASAFNPETETVKEQKKYSAIWDTGATMTAISQKVVSECGLKQIDIVQCSTASGVVEKCPVYLISLFLPNKVAFTQLRVSQVTLKGLDVLIGMDIINSGDFFLTNFKGRTIFNFRIPSLGDVNFTKNPTLCEHKQEPYKKESSISVGRNDYCPCGSGKKYKKCCIKTAA